MSRSEVRFKASFRIGVACSNCRRGYSRRLDVPDDEDAPGDVEELVESAFFREQRFVCPNCESMIASVRMVAPWQTSQEKQP